MLGNLNANQYFVTWEEDRYGTRSNNIYGQRVDADGALLGESLAVTDKPYDHNLPDVVFNSLIDEYLVVWTDEPRLGMLHVTTCIRKGYPQMAY